jgi:hypothetical protein
LIQKHQNAHVDFAPPVARRARHDCSLLEKTRDAIVRVYRHRRPFRDLDKISDFPKWRDRRKTGSETS